MEKTHESEVLEKAIYFLLILVSAILLFNWYQYSKLLSSGFLNILSSLLAIALIGSLVWLIVKQSKTQGSMNVLHEHHESHPLTFHEKLSYTLVVVVAVLVIFNQMQISQASTLMGLKTPLTVKSTSSKINLALTGDPMQDAMAIVIPRGTPFYGEGLAVSFDDPIRSLETIAQLDPAYGRNKVQLSEQEWARYITILTTPTITCEYCCGVKTAVTNEGRPTCGCKHSWAIRGLAAYLIKNYPELSNDEIMRELARWKSLFFPKQMIERYIQETQTGQYTPDIASLLLDVDEDKLEELKQTMVSQPESNGNTVSDIQNLPNMVGGC